MLSFRLTVPSSMGVAFGMSWSCMGGGLCSCPVCADLWSTTQHTHRGSRSSIPCCFFLFPFSFYARLFCWSEYTKDSSRASPKVLLPPVPSIVAGSCAAPVVHIVRQRTVTTVPSLAWPDQVHAGGSTAAKSLLCACVAHESIHLFHSRDVEERGGRGNGSRFNQPIHTHAHWGSQPIVPLHISMDGYC